MTKVGYRIVLKFAKQARLADRDGRKTLCRDVRQEVREAELTDAIGRRRGSGRKAGTAADQALARAGS